MSDTHEKARSMDKACWRTRSRDRLHDYSLKRGSKEVSGATGKTGVTGGPVLASPIQAAYDALFR